MQRNGWVNALVFHLAQVIVSENIFVGSSEGEVVGKGVYCLHLFTMLDCLSERSGRVRMMKGNPLH
jgi:hypothetical protein